MIKLTEKLMKYHIRMSMEPSDVLPGYITVYLRTPRYSLRGNLNMELLNSYRGDQDYILVTKLNELVDEFIAKSKCIYTSSTDENEIVMAPIPSISEMRAKYGDDMLQVKVTSTNGEFRLDPKEFLKAQEEIGNPVGKVINAEYERFAEEQRRFVENHKKNVEALERLATDA